jgi:hypothetical protein
MKPVDTTLLLAASLSTLAYACGSGDSGAQASSNCPPGVICGDPGSGAGGPGAGGAGAGAGSTGPSGGCAEAWECSPWDGNGTDVGIRACVDKNACGTEKDKPATMATLPALDLNYYKCNVEPIMDRKCSQLGCHGTEEGRALRIYARGRHRYEADSVVHSNDSCLKLGQSTPLANCIGSIECACSFEPHTPTEWQRNYDAARGMLLDARGAEFADPEQSDLIRQPIVGGKAHAGIHLFRQGDPEHMTLRAWLGGASLANCTTNN